MTGYDSADQAIRSAAGLFRSQGSPKAPRLGECIQKPKGNRCTHCKRVVKPEKNERDRFHCPRCKRLWPVERVIHGRVDTGKRGSGEPPRNLIQLCEIQAAMRSVQLWPSRALLFYALWIMQGKNDEGAAQLLLSNGIPKKVITEFSVGDYRMSARRDAEVSFFMRSVFPRTKQPFGRDSLRNLVDQGREQLEFALAKRGL